MGWFGGISPTIFGNIPYNSWNLFKENSNGKRTQLVPQRLEERAINRMDQSPQTSKSTQSGNPFVHWHGRGKPSKIAKCFWKVVSGFCWRTQPGWFKWFQMYFKVVFQQCLTAVCEEMFVKIWDELLLFWEEMIGRFSCTSQLLV